MAVSIHYFYLAGFAWMLMEGIYFYLKVVKVFNTIVKMKLFYAFSWGEYWNIYSALLCLNFANHLILYKFYLRFGKITPSRVRSSTNLTLDSPTNNIVKELFFIKIRFPQHQF